jgi:phage terminase Nu1 subunit (DNA packaging protein)
MRHSVAVSFNLQSATVTVLCNVDSVSLGSQMSALHQRITIMTDLIAQLRELDQLRERVRKAGLTAEDTDDKRDENLTVAIETYMATFEGHTPEQAKAKAMER